MNDETAFILKSWAVIIVSIILLALISVHTGIPVSFRLPWDFGVY